MVGRSRQERQFCPLVGCDVAESDMADRARLSMAAKTSATIKAGPLLTHNRSVTIRPFLLSYLRRRVPAAAARIAKVAAGACEHRCSR